MTVMAMSKAPNNKMMEIDRSKMMIKYLGKVSPRCEQQE